MVTMMRLMVMIVMMATVTSSWLHLRLVCSGCYWCRHYILATSFRQVALSRLIR